MSSEKCGSCQFVIRIQDGKEWEGTFDDNGHYEPHGLHKCGPDPEGEKDVE